MPLGAMISIVNRTHYIVLNERLRQFGLSAGQFPVLICLIKKQNVMQDTLARHFHIDKGAVARAVTKLVDAGYVQRIPDPDNRRAVRLFLTEKGEQIVPEIKRIDREWEEMTCSCLPPDDRQRFGQFLSKIAGSCMDTLKNMEEQ
jgi:DNA-binding MarR family transcriptional regulator